MGYQTPKVTSNGDGMWSGNAPANSPSGSSDNILSQVGQNTRTVSNSAPMKGSPSGPGVGANGPSPDQNLLSTGSAGNGKPGVGNGPSPDQNLLSSKSGNVSARKPSFGGMEKGVQIP